MQEAMTVRDPATMEAVPADGESIGEIMFRGNIVMSGYLKNPTSTDEAFAGGWLHTGDLAVIEPDGYVRIKDRSKDVIISGGENISSIELEYVLHRHPAVDTAAVVAKPDPKWGEVPCAFIELRPNATVSEAEIRQFCRNQMAGYKVPGLVVLEPIPKNATGKAAESASARTHQDHGRGGGMTYAAPLEEMRFVLDRLAGLPQIAALPGFEDAQPDVVEAILTEAARFASEVLAPLNATGDRQGCRWEGGRVTTPDGFPLAYRQFVDAGWHAMPVSPAIGGQGMPALLSSAVAEMWKSANLAFSLCQMLTIGAVEALAHHASDELKARFLPKMVAGEWTGTMNLTEPQAGSDLSAVRTRAEPDGEHYRLFGSKIFITWGEHDVAENIIHLVLARLPDAPDGTRGISLFVAPKFLVAPDGSLGARNDLSCVSIEHKLGIHASPTAIMSYGDKEGAIAYLVGEPNHGLEYMFTMMNHARLNVGLEGVAVAEAAYQKAVAYARTRVQGKPIGGSERASIIHHPDVRRMLMDMKARTEAMRALAYVTAACMDRARHHPDPDERRRSQGRVEFLTPVVKGWSTETSINIASTGIQVHGGMGYVEETGAAQYLRDARITTIYEGTTGIQAIDLIGRKLIRDNGANAAALIGDIEAEVAAFAPTNDPDLSAIGAALKTGLKSFQEATDWLLANQRQKPARSRRRRGSLPQADGCGRRRVADGAGCTHCPGSDAGRRKRQRIPERQDRDVPLLCRACVAGGRGMAP